MDYLNFSMQCNGILDYNGPLVMKKKKQKKRKGKKKHKLCSLLSSCSINKETTK